MATPIIQRSFAAGELAPTFFGRADTTVYGSGLKRCRNFFVRKEGGVSNRAGFRFIKAAKVMSSLVRLYRWAFTAADTSTLIEAGHMYFRFYRGGAPLTVLISGLDAWDASAAYVQGDLVSYGGVAYYAKQDTTGDQPDTSSDDWYALEDDNTNAIYEVPTPYSAGAFDSPGPLNFTQSGTIITITHPGYAPMELQNLDPLGTTPAWVLVPVSTDPSIAAPQNGSGTAGVAGTRAVRYVVTAVAAETYEESLPSDVIEITSSDDPTEDAPNVLGWDAVSGAAEYNVYEDRYLNGTFGFIGVATGQTTFNDTGFAPDFEQTPPIQRTLFASQYDYPELSAFYQQRRLFGYTDNKPATVWASRTGFRSNFTIRSPLQDDDAITFTHAGNDMNVVRHLIPLKRLIMLTETGEWVVRGDADGVLLPTAINLDQEGYAGSSRAFPAIAGSNIVYVQARGSLVRDLRFTTDIAPIDTRDLTIFANHLFAGHTIARLEYQQDPNSIIWAVRDDGVLLGLTYIPGADIWGWHRHDTAQNDSVGVIEDVCVVPEEAEDVLYAVIRRTIDGSEVRYIERLASREINETTFANDVFFVDCGATYSGSPATTISGLDHLEGEVVAVVADGDVLYDGDPTGADAEDFRVTGGAITLDAAHSVVHVGLAIRYAQIETLEPDAPNSAIRDQRKVITSLGVLVDATVQGFKAGPDADHLIAQRPDPWETDPSARVSKRVTVAISGGWSDEGRIFIRQTLPMPLTILAVLPSVEFGG